MNVEDFMTGTWRRLRSDLEDRLQDLRRLNDDPSKDHAQTALVRGQIKEVKRILALEQSSASPEVGPE